MTTQGIEAVFIETHNYGKTVKFFQTLGYELESDTGLDVVTPWEDTHFGTTLMTVRDPDGQLWNLQAPARATAHAAPADTAR